jgi:hypothetical protein
MIETKTFIQCNHCGHEEEIDGKVTDPPAGWSEFVTHFPIHKNKRKHLCVQCTEAVFEHLREKR